MRCIPVIVSEDYYDLFIILEEDNLQRIKNYDPAELITTNLSVPFLTRKVNNIVIMYATNEDLKVLNARCDQGDVRGALRHLSRGYAWRPDRGDQVITDGYPESRED